MLLTFRDLTIRNATVNDAKQLETWWNDGAVMAHAGFPNGLGTTAEAIADSLGKDTDDTCRRLIVEFRKTPIGEMNYRNIGSKTAEIGIKICDFSLHDRGLGKILLSMLIASLFHDLKYEKIFLDTNLNNKRAQHVYETLGFRKVSIHENSWRNQLGELQSKVDYELLPNSFHSFADLSELIAYSTIDDELEKKLNDVFGNWITEYQCLHYGEGCYSVAALCQGKPVGFISTCSLNLPSPLQQCSEAYIDVLEVHENFRRQGIASQLVLMTEAWAKEYGYRQIRSWSSDDKLEAISMWYALGYGMCPAIMRGMSVKKEFDGKPIYGFYVSKVL